jgi:hypothetical protein
LAFFYLFVYIFCFVLAQMDAPLDLSVPSAQPVTLPPPTSELDPPAGIIVTISGWGTTSVRNNIVGSFDKFTDAYMFLFVLVCCVRRSLAAAFLTCSVVWTFQSCPTLIVMLLMVAPPKGRQLSLQCSVLVTFPTVITFSSNFQYIF